MTKYRIEHKKGSYLPGEEIKLHKITTAEKIGEAILKILLIAGIILNMIIIHG